MNASMAAETPALEALRARLLEATLRHVPFDGWTDAALAEGARDAGVDPMDARRAFPGGGEEVLDHFVADADRRMVEELERRDLRGLRLRDKIALAVRVRLEQAAPHREAIRRAVGLELLPFNLARAGTSIYRTVDAIWHAVGDTATDFSFYTKRALLAGVYASTLLYWLNDESEGFEDTWAFLDRRIDDVMGIQQARGRLERAVTRLSGRPSRGPRRGFR